MSHIICIGSIVVTVTGFNNEMQVIYAMLPLVTISYISILSIGFKSK